MGVVLAVVVACLALPLYWSLEWAFGQRDRPGPGPRYGRTTAAPQHAARRTERCLLCDGPLPPELLTREQVIARVERRIDSDTSAVSQLLANPPSADWNSLFRA